MEGKRSAALDEHMTQRLEELIWAEIDGELNAAEARELADLRAEASDPLGLESEVQIEIRELAAGLEEVEEVEVPASLKPRILTAVEERRRFQSRGKPAPVVTPRPAERPLFRAKWGYLAAGIILGGVLVYQLASRTAPGPESDLVGTVPPTRPSESVVDPRTGLAPSGGAVLPQYLQMSARDRFLDVSLDLGAGSTILVIAAPGLELEEVGYRDGARGSHEAGSDRISVQAVGPGHAELALVVPDANATIRLSVRGDGLESFETELSINQLSGR